MKIVAPINEGIDVTFLPLNEEEAVRNELAKDVCAVIIEGIQGVGGIKLPTPAFLQFLRKEVRKPEPILFSMRSSRVTVGVENFLLTNMQESVPILLL